MSKLVKRAFTVSGSWICPPGVTAAIITGYGGGGAGGGGGLSASGNGASSPGGGGGGGSTQSSITVTVVPGTTYTVTVGAGGTPLGAHTSPFGSNGGGTSIFASPTATLAAFRGGMGGGSSNDTPGAGFRFYLGGLPCDMSIQAQSYWDRFSTGITTLPQFIRMQPGEGGAGFNAFAPGGSGVISMDGAQSIQSWAGGLAGYCGITSTQLGGGGGGGGGAGPGGVGGDGDAGGGGGGAGNGLPATISGTAGAANTGAGGGGGGCGGNGVSVGGSSTNGHAGGSGLVIVTWIE